jgi:hypothetical protein
VSTTDARLGAYLDDRLSDAPPADRATYSYGIAELAPHGEGPDGEAESRVVLRRNGRTIATSEHRGPALARLLWQMNRDTERASARRVLFHAGLVAFDDRAVMLVGPSGSGKSTLTALLCAAGARLGTDELVAVDPVNGTIDCARRPITLKLTAFGPRGLGGSPPAGLEDAFETVRPVRSADFGVEVLGAVPASLLVVFPQWDRSAGALQLEPIERADAVVGMVRNCLNVRARGVEAFAAAVDVLRRADVWTGRFADGSALVEAITAECSG